MSMGSASANSGSASPRKPRPLPEFYREYQARMAHAATPAAGTSERSLAAISWKQHFRNWLLGPDGRACGVSLIFHALLLTIFSLVALRHGTGGNPFGVSLREGEAASAEYLENLLEGESESAGGAEGLSATTIVAAPAAGPGGAEIESPIRPEVDLQSTLAGLDAGLIDVGDPSALTQEIDEFSGTGKGRGKGSGIGNLTDGFSRPGGGKVVKKGRFAAWTVPSDPRPRQDYLIVIEVEYPKTKETKLLRKRRNDLTGTVQGTDTYFQVIEKTGYFIPKSNQMVIPVPGAEMNVRDVIQVRSKILEESQELLIVF